MLNQRKQEEKTMDEFGRVAAREAEARRIARRQWFWPHGAVFAAVQIYLYVIWLLGSKTHPWFLYPLFGWLILVAAHAVVAFVVRTPEEILVEREAKQAGERP
jgi:hypothetical protein